MVKSILQNNMRQILRHIIFCSLCLGLFGTINSQSAFDTKEINISAAHTQMGVRLLWTPDDFETFNLGLINGYTLKRYTVSQDGIETPLSALNSTQVIINTNLFPLPEGDTGWNGTYGSAAESLIYYENLDIDTSSPNLADAYTLTQENIERYQFGVFIAYLDFDIAQKMGLAYEDTTVDPNATYSYRISVNSTPDKDITTVVTDSLTNFATISNVDAKSQYGIVNVSWPIEELTNDYFAFNILRSEDDVNFSKINEEPYIFLQTGGEDPSTYIYQDSTATYGTTFYYAVEGITVFGVLGEQSESVSVLSVPYLTGIDPVVSADDSSTSAVSLSWIINNTDQEVTDFIAGYNVYRSRFADSGYELITSSPITGSSFVDNQPLTSAYYIVATVDDFGQEFRSLPEFAQIEDMTAPAIPIQLSARESATNQYELTWTANQEIDLEGYLLFTKYAGSDNYIMISKDIIQDTSFLFDYPPDLATNQICFMISSIDVRGNESDMSDCVFVVLPDNLAPATPHMTKHEPVESGVVLGWTFSTSLDVVQHDLQRKPTGAPEWETIEKIRKNDEIRYFPDVSPWSLIPGNYIDSSYTELRSYDYRICAIDGSDNSSCSSIVSVAPLFLDAIATIENFNVSGVTIVEPGIMPQQDAYQIIQNVIAELTAGNTPNYTLLELLVVYRILTAQEYDSLPSMSSQDALSFLEERRDDYWTADRFVTLNWDYDNLDQLLYFQIYRSIDGRGFIDFVDILPEAGMFSYSYDDGYIMEGHSYLYKIMAVHAGGRFSEVSEPKLVRVN